MCANVKTTTKTPYSQVTIPNSKRKQESHPTKQPKQDKRRKKETKVAQTIAQLYTLSVWLESEGWRPASL